MKKYNAFSAILPGSEGAAAFRRVLILACMAVLLFSQPFRAEAVTIVDDAAQLLSSEEEETLYTQIESLSALLDLDVMVVTTEDAMNMSSEEYGDHYYLEHCSGDDGVLYLIDMENREIHISTSGIMIYYLTDARIEQCLDDGYEYVSGSRYASGFQAMIRDTVSYVKSGEGADYTRDRDTGEIIWLNDPGKKRITTTEGLLAGLLGLLAGGGPMAGVFARYRMKTGGYQYDYRSNHGLNLYRRSDDFRTRRVTSRRIPKNRDGGGGFGGGGGSTTHSSGGHSFGGGSRKF